MENATNQSSYKEAKLKVAYLKNIQQHCKSFCLIDYKQENLNTGEKMCIDRCFAKYLETSDYVMKLYQEEQINS